MTFLSIAVSFYLFKNKVYPFEQAGDKIIEISNDLLTDEGNLVTPEIVNTSIHKINSKKLKRDYDHIAILAEDKDTTTLLGVKGNGSLSTEIKIGIVIDQITYEKKSQTIEVETIYNIEDSQRVTDILIQDERIFLSYVNVNDVGFAGLRIDEIIIEENQSIKNILIYQTSFTSPPYVINASGGKMAIDGNNNIYLGVGTFNKDYLIDEANQPFGKILVAKLNSNNETLKFKIHAIGTRNVQGLVWSKFFKQLIATEHGPQGGDEINLIKKKNYGWPHVTYGVPYGKENTEGLFADSGGARYGSHDDYQEPIFAFIPSIGIKSIEQMGPDQYTFPYWSNNFIITSTRGIFRSKIINDSFGYRMVFMEKLLECDSSDACRDLAISRTGIIFTNSMQIITRNKSSNGN